MDSPFHFPITDIGDLERLLTALGTSTELTPGSLHLAGGAEQLAGLLADDRRRRAANCLEHANTPGGLIALFRCLWTRPLPTGLECSLLLQATLAFDPNILVSLRVALPTMDDRPTCVLIEANSDPVASSHLTAVYRSIGRAAGLPFEQVEV